MYLKIMENRQPNHRISSEMRVGPDQETLIYEGSPPSLEESYQFERVYGQFISSSYMYDELEAHFVDKVNIFLGSENVERFQIFIYFVNSYIKQLNDLTLEERAGDQHDNDVKHILQLTNPEYVVEVQTMAPRAPIIHKEPEVACSNEICVSVCHTEQVSQTVFYFGPNFSLQNRIFYFLFSKPAETEKEMLLNFKEHILLRNVYLDIKPTNILFFIREHENNQEILKFSEEFYNGVLRKAGRAHIDQKGDDTNTVNVGVLERLNQEIERYKRCFESERILRIQQDRQHQEEVDSLKEQVAQLKDQLRAVQHEISLHESAHGRSALRMAERRRVEDE